MYDGAKSLVNNGISAVKSGVNYITDSSFPHENKEKDFC
jgi:hypothetical protein